MNIKQILISVSLSFLFFSCASLKDPGSDYSIYYNSQICDVISEEMHLIRFVESGYLENILQTYIVAKNRRGEVVRIDYKERRPISIIPLRDGKNYTFNLKNIDGRFSSLNIEYSDYQAELSLYYHQYKKFFNSPFALAGIKGVQADSLLYNLDKQGKVKKILVGDVGTINIERSENSWFLTSETKNSFSLPFYITCQWNDRGNPVSLVFTDKQGKAVFHPGWNFSRKNYDYNNDGLLIKEEYFDNEAKPAWPVNMDFRYFSYIIENSPFYPSSLTYTYKGKDLRGAVIQYCSEEDDNIPGEGSILINREQTVLYSGTKEPVYSVNNNGNIEERKYYTNGNLQQKSILIIDPENNRKEVKFLRGNNISSIHYTYDAEGQIISLSSTDNPGTSIHYLYDKRGNLKELTYRNNENRLTEVDGIAVEVTLYNSRDLVTDYIFYNKNRLPTTGPEGFYRKSVEYNRLGRIKKTAWFDCEGNPLEQGAYASVLRESTPDSLTETCFNSDLEIVKKEYSFFYPEGTGYVVDVKEDAESKTLTKREIFNSLGLLTESLIYAKNSSNIQERMIITYNNKNRIDSVACFKEMDTAGSEAGGLKKQHFFYNFLGKQTVIIDG